MAEYTEKDFNNDDFFKTFVKTLRRIADRVENREVVLEDINYSSDLKEYCHRDFDSKRNGIVATSLSFRYRVHDLYENGNHDHIIEYHNEKIGSFKRRKGCYSAVLYKYPQSKSIVCCHDNGVYEFGEKEPCTDEIAWISQRPVEHADL